MDITFEITLEFDLGIQSMKADNADTVTVTMEPSFGIGVAVADGPTLGTVAEPSEMITLMANHLMQYGYTLTPDKVKQCLEFVMRNLERRTKTPAVSKSPFPNRQAPRRKPYNEET